MNLIQVDHLADQLLSCLYVVGETYSSLCPVAKAMVSHAILAGKQLAVVSRLLIYAEGSFGPTLHSSFCKLVNS